MNAWRGKRSTAQLKLLDPAWGGVYQYSTDGDWQHPHFEKIMQIQAEDLRDLRLAYALWHDPTYLAGRESNSRVSEEFSDSAGRCILHQPGCRLDRWQAWGRVFSARRQDRRKQGIPRVDKHVYSRENGWAINALDGLYTDSGERECLDERCGLPIGFAPPRSSQWRISSRCGRFCGSLSRRHPVHGRAFLAIVRG